MDSRENFFANAPAEYAGTMAEARKMSTNCRNFTRYRAVKICTVIQGCNSVKLRYVPQRYHITFARRLQTRD